MPHSEDEKPPAYDTMYPHLPHKYVPLQYTPYRLICHAYTQLWYTKIHSLSQSQKSLTMIFFSRPHEDPSTGNDTVLGNEISLTKASGKETVLTNDVTNEGKPDLKKRKDKHDCTRTAEEESNTKTSKTFSSGSGKTIISSDTTNKPERRVYSGNDKTKAKTANEKGGEADNSQGGSKRRLFLARAATITHETREVLM